MISVKYSEGKVLILSKNELLFLYKQTNKSKKIKKIFGYI